MNQPCSILLLDDEPLILMDLELAVEDLECTPFSATTLEEANRLLDEHGTVSVAILDVTLAEGQTCYSLAQRLEKMGIPYLIHSGDLNRQDERVRSLGAEFIPKPASADLVVEKARELANLTCSDA